MVRQCPLLQGWLEGGDGGKKVQPGPLVPAEARPLLQKALPVLQVFYVQQVFAELLGTR